ncbi:hypothetical protein ACROYT_G032331 [Oculina patagonica]
MAGLQQLFMDSVTVRDRLLQSYVSVAGISLAGTPASHGYGKNESELGQASKSDCYHRTKKAEGGSSCAYRYNSAAFLFSLVNQPGWKPLQIYQTGKDSPNKAHSIYSCSSYGPTFGGGHDFYIASYASTRTNSYTNLGYTYGPPAGHSYGSSFAKSFLAGSYKFQPDEVEVFYETT